MPTKLYLQIQIPQPKSFKSVQRSEVKAKPIKLSHIKQLNYFNDYIENIFKNDIFHKQF